MNKEIDKKIKAYHLSNTLFNDFSNDFINSGAGNRYGKGFYFSSKPWDKYSKYKYVCELTIKNPLIFSSIYETLYDYIKQTNSQETYASIVNKYDGIIIEDAINKSKKEYVVFDKSNIKILKVFEKEPYINGKYVEITKDISNKTPTDSDNINEDFNISDYYDSRLKIESDEIQKFLDKYIGDCSIKLIDQEKCKAALKNRVGVFLRSIQDDAHIFPIALNKDIILKFANGDVRTVCDQIIVTLAHEVGHGISFLIDDVIDLSDYDMEQIVEDFAEDYLYGDESGSKLVELYKEYESSLNEDTLNESLKLDEATRSQLINKTKSSDNYKDQSKGKNRWDRRTKSRIANSVAQYNKVDMDALFKRDILTLGVDVHGETDDYVVTVRFVGLLKEVQREIKANNGKLEYKVIARAMSRVFNSGDVSLHCTCPDFKYRQSYNASKQNYGTQYEPRPSNITNPNDTKGGGCKHCMLVLSNLDWMMKVSSVINNYIKYCQEHMEYNYATYIFPKVYGVPYKQAVQQSMFDTGGYLASDQKTVGDIAKTNVGQKDDKGRFIVGNKYRFNKKQNNELEEPNEDQLKFNFDENPKEVVPEEDAKSENSLNK